MFRFDMNTLRTTPLTKLVWPTCEDVGGLRVIGSAPTWILDVVAQSTDDDSPPRRYLFRDLSDVLEIGLGQPWLFRKLHLLTAAQAIPPTQSALLLIDAIWACEAGLGHSRFEIVGPAGSHYMDEFGHLEFQASQRQQRLWPACSSDLLQPATRLGTSTEGA